MGDLTSISVEDMKKLSLCAMREGTEGAIARALLALAGASASEPAPPTPDPVKNAVAAAIAHAPAFFEEMEKQNQLKRAKVQAVIQRVKDEFAARPLTSAGSSWKAVPRDVATVNKSLHDLLCSLIGGQLEQFLKYDPERKVVDYSANMAHLSMVVDLIDFMGIPGSGFEFAYYYSRSAPALRAQRAKKAMSSAIEEMHLLGGPGLAPDSAVEAFYRAKEELAVAEAALLKYEPNTVPVQSPQS